MFDLAARLSAPGPALKLDPIGVAVPFFIVLIAVELAVTRRRGLAYYGFVDAMACMATGVGNQVSGIFFGAAALWAYTGIEAKLGLFDLQADSVLTWLVAFVLVDFFYYWWHRASHRVNLLWAAHVVHHQSEEYNLAVALRQALFTHITYNPFFWGLALLGFPPLVVFTCTALNTLYQFWIHTRLVGKLPAWVESWLNTPSHHRVHHGVNPAYIDKNHAGVFIVWDRLFGTFVEEREEPVYGTVKGIASWDPIWANFDELAHLARRAKALGRWDWTLQLLFGPPEWRPAALGGPMTVPPHPVPGQRPQARAAVPRAVSLYVAAWFFPTVIALTLLLFVRPGWGSTTLWSAMLLMTLMSWGLLFDRRAVAVPFELARLGACLGFGLLLTIQGEGWAAALGPALAGLAMLSAPALFSSAERQPTALDLR